MIKRTLLLVVLFAVAACGTKHVEEKIEVKKEKPMWQMIMHAERGRPEISYEDRWFEYTMELERVRLTKHTNRNMIYGQCRFGGGTYTVTDKETGEVVRSVVVSGGDCKSCHRR